MRAAFRAGQKGGAHLHASRAQHPQGGDAAPIHDAAGGDNGNRDIFGQQRRQGEDAHQALFGVTDEGAAMTARLGPLSDDEIHAAFLQNNRFQHVGGGAQGDDPGIP